MKRYDNKQIKLIIFSMISGLFLTGFVLYYLRGTFGQTEIIVLAVTEIIATIILVIMIRRGNNSQEEAR